MSVSIPIVPAGIPADVPDVPADVPDVAGPAVPNGVVDAFYLLQNAEALYQSRLRDRLQLGANELAAMRYINRLQTLGRDVRAMDVTQSLGVTSGATSVILSHLVERGYLTRTVNPRDGRGKLLHLTEAARIAVSHTLDDDESDLSQLVSGLSIQDSERVVGLLAAVTSVLEQSGHAEL
jgi:DNA-binding MarR family transcriptional regulator